MNRLSVLQHCRAAMAYLFGFGWNWARLVAVPLLLLPATAWLANTALRAKAHLSRGTIALHSTDTLPRLAEVLALPEGVRVRTDVAPSDFAARITDGTVQVGLEVSRNAEGVPVCRATYHSERSGGMLSVTRRQWELFERSYRPGAAPATQSPPPTWSTTDLYRPADTLRRTTHGAGVWLALLLGFWSFVGAAYGAAYLFAPLRGANPLLLQSAFDPERYRGRLLAVWAAGGIAAGAFCLGWLLARYVVASTETVQWWSLAANVITPSRVAAVLLALPILWLLPVGALCAVVAQHARSTGIALTVLTVVWGAVVVQANLLAAIGDGWQWWWAAPGWHWLGWGSVLTTGAGVWLPLAASTAVAAAATWGLLRWSYGTARSRQ